MRLFTIGFTGHTAEAFFSTLQVAQVRRVIDVRLHNTSQLAGFSKKDDLQYFLSRLLSIEYVHSPILAPTKELLVAYRNSEIDWNGYAAAFATLLRERRIESTLDAELFATACLLCSEKSPEKCHRRIVAEYLQKHWRSVAIEHLR